MEFVLSVLLFVGIVCFGIFVQAAAGFGAGLLVVPVLLWTGYQVPEAQSALMIATVPQNIIVVYSLRDAIKPRQILWPAVMRLLFLPVGVFALMHLETLSAVAMRQIVGGAVVAVTVALLVINPTPRKQLHPAWGVLAFPLSGLLQGVIGMGGPPMVFWLQGHDWDTRQTRGFLFAMFLISTLPAILVLYAAFGDRIFRPMIVTAALIPLLLLVTHAGLRFGTALGRRRLRAVTFVLLLLVGVAGLAAPWMRP